MSGRTAMFSDSCYFGRKHVCYLQHHSWLVPSPPSCPPFQERTLHHGLAVLSPSLLPSFSLTQWRSTLARHTSEALLTGKVEDRHTIKLHRLFLFLANVGEVPCNNMKQHGSYNYALATSCTCAVNRGGANSSLLPQLNPHFLCKPWTCC